MKRSVILIITALLLNIGHAAASDATFEGSVALGFLSGDTSYEIGNALTNPNLRYFPFSELIFPLDGTVAILNGRIQIADKVVLHGHIMKDIYSTDEEFQDTDWLNGPGAITQMSTGETDMDAWTVEAGLRYIFYRQPTWSFDIGPAYMRQHFNFDVSRLQQTDYRNNPPTISLEPGKVLTYEVDYSIPYLALGWNSWTDKMKVHADLGFTPWVRATDKDNHLTRNKISRGDSGGYAYMVEFGMQFFLPDNFFIDLTYNQTNIATKGDQVQDVISGGSLTRYTVDQELESRQGLATMAIGVKF